MSCKKKNPTVNTLPLLLICNHSKNINSELENYFFSHTVKITQT